MIRDRNNEKRRGQTKIRRMYQKVDQQTQLYIQKLRYVFVHVYAEIYIYVHKCIFVYVYAEMYMGVYIDTSYIYTHMYLYI